MRWMKVPLYLTLQGNNPVSDIAKFIDMDGQPSQSLPVVDWWALLRKKFHWHLSARKFKQWNDIV